MSRFRVGQKYMIWGHNYRPAECEITFIEGDKIYYDWLDNPPGVCHWTMWATHKEFRQWIENAKNNRHD